MSSKTEKDQVTPEFDHLFEFSSPKDELKHEARMIMYRFLSEIDRISGDMPKKEIARAIGTSASFVTQLFNGDKLINLMTLAKLQRAFEINFSIEAKPRQETFEVELSTIRGSSIPDFSSHPFSGETIKLDALAKENRPFKPLTRA